MSDTSFILAQLWQLPAILLAVVGIIIALVRWKRHPVVSMVALIAFVLLLGSRLISSGLFAYQYWQTSQNAGAPSFMDIYRFVQPVLVLLGFLSQALMILAIFGWRSAATGPPIES